MEIDLSNGNTAFSAYFWKLMQKWHELIDKAIGNILSQGLFLHILSKNVLDSVSHGSVFRETKLQYSFLVETLISRKIEKWKEQNVVFY